MLDANGGEPRVTGRASRRHGNGVIVSEQAIGDPALGPKKMCWHLRLRGWSRSSSGNLGQPLEGRDIDAQLLQAHPERLAIADVTACVADVNAAVLHIRDEHINE